MSLKDKVVYRYGGKVWLDKVDPHAQALLPVEALRDRLKERIDELTPLQFEKTWAFHEHAALVDLLAELEGL